MANTIEESLHQIRKMTMIGIAFNFEESLFKLVYQAYREKKDYVLGKRVPNCSATVYMVDDRF